MNTVINQTFINKERVIETIKNAETRKNFFDWHFDDDEDVDVIEHWIWRDTSDLTRPHVALQCVHCKNCGGYIYSNTFMILVTQNPIPKVLFTLSCKC